MSENSDFNLAQGQSQDGVVIGNTFDKYGSSNPLVKWMLRGFSDALFDLVKKTAATEVHEVGCGEGYWTIGFADRGLKARGSDFSSAVLAMAQQNASESSQSISFKEQSIYDLTQSEDAAELIVCCEVLEHLEDPEQAVDKLAELASPYLITSVPREPIWRILNMARGKYWGDWGNTPGHLQHWSSTRFRRLLERRFTVEEVRQPLPWTMLLCRRLD
ncbi:MAG: hypothetical protein SynsKO_03440 [Synoicihabitans sp.]